jgi:[ribosomal protein S18]-alanine N-acetyltransferase
LVYQAELIAAVICKSSNLHRTASVMAKHLNYFKFTIMDRISALTISEWRYSPPYDFYNPDENTIVGFVDGMLNATFQYYSVWNKDNQMIGYCCFGEDARVLGGDYSDDALDVGGGLRPDLTGQGFGAPFIESVFKFGTACFSPQVLRTTVAAFNLRAIKVCEKVGCIQSSWFFNTQLDQSFVILKKRLFVTSSLVSFVSQV